MPSHYEKVDMKKKYKDKPFTPLFRKGDAYERHNTLEFAKDLANNTRASRSAAVRKLIKAAKKGAKLAKKGAKKGAKEGAKFIKDTKPNRTRIVKGLTKTARKMKAKVEKDLKKSSIYKKITKSK